MILKPPTRKLVYKMMVASPVVLIVGIVAQARFQTDPFDTISFSSAQHDRMTAYRDLVVRTEDTLDGPEGERIEVISKLADDWISAYRDGKLYSIPPACGSDGLEDSIRSEILESINTFGKAVLRNGLKAERDGDSKVASELLLKSAQLGEIGKYSDFQTLSSCRAEQVRSLRTLDMLQIDDPAQRRIIASQLGALLKDQKPLDSMASAARNQYYETLRREGLEPVSILEPPISKRSKKPVKPLGLMLASKAKMIPEIDSAVRVGERLQEQFKSRLEESIQEWAAPAKSIKQ